MNGSRRTANPDAAAIGAAVVEITDALDPSAVGRSAGEQLIAAIPELGQRSDEDLEQAVLASVVSAVADAWEGLRSERPLARVALSAETVALAQEVTRRNMDVTTLLRGYRVGHSLVMEQCERAAGEIDLDPDVRWRALARISRYLFGYVDVLSLQASELYLEERERWVRGAAAARAEVVEALLAGRDVDLERATVTLGYDLRGAHVAFVMWVDSAASAGPLEAHGATLARLLGGGPTLLIPAGARVLWGWTSSTRLGAAPPHDLAALPSGVRAAVGSSHEGAAGFARSHREAFAARRVATLLGRSGIVSHRSIALTSLLTADRAAAVEFVESELGALAGDGDAMRRVRSTLRLYLEEHASPVRTARRLGIHHNTVVYRVKQAEELLGRSVGERRMELEIALRLAESLGVLRGGSDSQPRGGEYFNLSADVPRAPSWLAPDKPAI